MSPEQARGEAIDVRADLFALGVTLYELTTGGLGPYTASRQESDQVLRQVRSGEMLPVRVLAPEVPPGLERILKKAMQHKPSRRYQVAEEMVANLEQLERETPSKSPARSTRLRLAWSRPPTGLVGLLVVLLAAVLAWMLWPAGPRNPDPPQGPPGTGTSAAAPANAPAREGGAGAASEPLRQRQFHVPLALQKTTLEPVWARKLFDTKGYYRALPMGLSLFSPAEPFPTLIALDDDPEHRWFEFSVEMQQIKGLARGEGGVFFGWRRRPGEPANPFFLVRIEEGPEGAASPGRFEALVALLDEGARNRGSLTWEQPLPQGKGRAELRDRPAGGWHKVRVRAVDDAVTVSVGSASVSFDVRDLKDPLPGSAAAPDALGALGIWAHDRVLFFRGASVAALPSEKHPEGR
jgi:hypothetical protein